MVAAAVRIMITILSALSIPWMAAAMSPQIRREQQPDPTSLSQVYMSSDGMVGLGKAHSFIRSEADPATDDAATNATDDAATDATDATATTDDTGTTAAAATTATTDLTAGEEE